MLQPEFSCDPHQADQPVYPDRFPRTGYTPGIIRAAATQALFAVLFVADMFQPVDVLPVQRLLNGDVRHRDRGRCAMPVPQTGREPDHVTGPHVLDGSAVSLNPAEPCRNDQSLPKRVRMPRGAGARLEGDAAPPTRPGSGAWKSGSIRTVPVNYSVGPLRDGCDPPRVICMLSSVLCAAAAAICAAPPVSARAANPWMLASTSLREIFKPPSCLSQMHTLRAACPRDGQLADPFARRMKDGVGDRGGYAHHGDLAHALHPGSHAGRVLPQTAHP